MEDSKKEKYIGDIIGNSGKIRSTIEERKKSLWNSLRNLGNPGRKSYSQAQDGNRPTAQTSNAPQWDAI